MFAALRQTSALFAGIAIIWTGAGLLHTLIVLRASAEGFSTAAIGVLQSAYQVGWLLAAVVVPALIRQVGHVRVFGAVGAVGSAVILLHLFHIDAWSWSAERLLMGICTAGLMILAESWLNDMADNRSRGQLLAVYTMLSWGTPVLGVSLLRLGDIEGPGFFLLASVLISIGAVPILLSASRTPGFIEHERLGVRRLFAITPLGVTATLGSGLCHGAFFGLVTLFGTDMALATAQTATLTAVALGAGILTQWPIAMLSDRFDRRAVLCATAALGAAAGASAWFSDGRDPLQLYLGVAALSAATLSLYSQCIAHANDHLSAAQIVPASATLVLIYGIGFALSPSIGGLLLAREPMSFFAFNALLLGALALNVAVRMARRPAPLEQGELVPVATTSPYTTVVTAAEQWSEQEETVFISDYDDPAVLLGEALERQKPD